MFEKDSQICLAFGSAKRIVIVEERKWLNVSVLQRSKQCFTARIIRRIMISGYELFL